MWINQNSRSFKSLQMANCPNSIRLSKHSLDSIRRIGQIRKPLIIWTCLTKWPKLWDNINSTSITLRWTSRWYPLKMEPSDKLSQAKTSVDKTLCSKLWIRLQLHRQIMLCLEIWWSSSERSLVRDKAWVLCKHSSTHNLRWLHRIKPTESLKMLVAWMKSVLTKQTQCLEAQISL